MIGKYIIPAAGTIHETVTTIHHPLRYKSADCSYARRQLPVQGDITQYLYHVLQHPSSCLTSLLRNKAVGGYHMLPRKYFLRMIVFHFVQGISSCASVKGEREHLA